MRSHLFKLFATDNFTRTPKDVQDPIYEGVTYSIEAEGPGEGKGYPFQYSGLENSMDCIVNEVAKSRTQLSPHSGSTQSKSFR